MRRRGRRVAERATGLGQPAAVEPALLHAFGHRPAVGLELAAAHMVMSALVMEHKQADIAASDHGVESAGSGGLDDRHRDQVT